MNHGNSVRMLLLALLWILLSSCNAARQDAAWEPDDRPNLICAGDGTNAAASAASHVQVVEPDAPYLVVGTFAGACASAVPMWNDLQLEPDLRPAPSLAIAGFCNPNGFALRLTSPDGPHVLAASLPPQECVALEPLAITSTIRILPLTESLATSSHCAATQKPPPEIPVEVFLACSR